MPQARTQQPAGRAGQVAKAYATVQGAQAAARAPTIPPAAAALGSGALATVTAATMSAFITWLAEARRRNQAYLAKRLSRRGQPGDVAKVIQAEMLLEQEFARRAADRLATKLPAALAIADRAEREAAVRQALADEERYGRQRQEAMLARALAALTRSDLRSSSPLGAFWKLGHAQQHTQGCLTLAGRFWPWAVLDRVHPPRHYGCLVAGTVVWGPAVRRAYGRWYEGQIVRVTFRSGREVRITPNHPVLKRGGWVAADALRVGDEVVCCSAEEMRMRVGDPDEVQVPAAIEDVAGALADAGDVQAVRVPVAAKDFHGDGREGYVDVVRAGGLLDDRLVIAPAQQACEFAFGFADSPSTLLTCYSAAGESVVAVRFASFGSVRGAGLGEALLVRESAFAELGGVAAATERDVRLAEATQDRGGRDADRPADGFGAFAGEVATDEIVGVEWVIGWRGHVHNLETREGWYSAGGIVVHNCTSSLHGYHDAVGNGLMRPEDVPDVRAAVRAAAGVMMEGEAGRVLAELDVRDRLEEVGVDTAAIPFAGVSEAFEEVEHPRDWKGRWIVSGAAFAKRASDSLAARWGEFDTPSSRAKMAHTYGGVRQHQDKGALDALEAAEQRNADDGQAELYPTFGHPPVRLEENLGEGLFGALALAEGSHLRVSAGALRRNDYLNGKRPLPNPGDFTTAHDVAAMLRHEWFHVAEGLLTTAERSEYLSLFPRKTDRTFDWDRIAADLSLNASANPTEASAELYALASDPKLHLSQFPDWVQQAGYAVVEVLYRKAGIA